MGATPLGHGLTGLLAALLPLLAHLLSVHAASSAFFSAGFSPRLPFYHFCLVQKSEWHPIRKWEIWKKGFRKKIRKKRSIKGLYWRDWYGMIVLNKCSISMPLEMAHGIGQAYTERRLMFYGY